MIAVNPWNHPCQAVSLKGTVDSPLICMYQLNLLLNWECQVYCLTSFICLLRTFVLRSGIRDRLPLNFAEVLVWIQEASYQQAWIQTVFLTLLTVSPWESQIHRKSKGLTKLWSTYLSFQKLNFLRQESDMLMCFKLHQFSYWVHYLVKQILCAPRCTLFNQPRISLSEKLLQLIDMIIVPFQTATIWIELFFKMEGFFKI